MSNHSDTEITKRFEKLQKRIRREFGIDISGLTSGQRRELFDEAGIYVKPRNAMHAIERVLLKHKDVVSAGGFPDAEELKIDIKTAAYDVMDRLDENVDTRKIRVRLNTPATSKFLDEDFYENLNIGYRRGE